MMSGVELWFNSPCSRSFDLAFIPFSYGRLLVGGVLDHPACPALLSPITPTKGSEGIEQARVTLRL
jgi:hypothetical protein